ncbi:MAG: DNA polymerase III subunit gamma/tau [Planctomycetota bacterium]|jgi:DNA polymerase-3 subunit gamma/tau
MAYTVLARKYRSQTFDDVIGQEPISQTLKNAIKTGKIAHAFLFTGTRGIGKTTMARILAKALNCMSSDEPITEPCCKCESCKAINIGEDIDVIEIDGASNNGVEEVRRLRENAIYRPARCRFKIYIIDEVHMLTVNAFNALLKILEEPPSHVKFIFATTEPNKVIPTIQSRCQRYDFRNISPAKIAGQLKFILEQEKIKFEEDLLLPLAKMSNGSMRDGLSLLDRLISTGIEPLTYKLLEDYLGCANSEKIYNLIDKIGNSDASGALEAVEELINSGHDELQIVDALVDYMRDVMVIKSTGADSELVVLTEQQRKMANESAEKFDIAALVYNITTLERLRYSIKNADLPRALLEAAILRFALSEHFMNVDELLARSNNGPVKKKQTVKKSTEKTIVKTNLEASYLADINSIKKNWQSILSVIGEELGKGTSSVLTSAEPTQFENNELILSFPTTAKTQKRMCESNSRVEKIESLLSEKAGRSISLKLILDENVQNHNQTSTRKKNELVNDPAVKTLLLELDATITGIEEHQSS